MRVSLILAAAVLGHAAMASGQGSATVSRLPRPSTCPVSFAVEQRTAGQVYRVGDHRSAGSSQYLEITVTPPEQKRILSAEISVRGTDGSLHALLVGRSAGDVEKTFHLRREADRLSYRQFGVWVEGMSSVRWVDLQSVTFADGTTLRSPGPADCRTEPNRLLLVGAASAP